MASPGERERMGGVRCWFPIGLGEVFRGSPHCTQTHVHLHPIHSLCSLSRLHKP